MITRAHVQGALKLLNAANIRGRREALRAMLIVEHSARDVDKILSDLSSYLEWGARPDLDEIPSPPAGSDPAVPPKRLRGAKRADA